MSVCKTCGKKYSKWTTPVSARGICRECFESKLARERNEESLVATDQPPSETVPVSVESASTSAAHSEGFGEKVDPLSRSPIEVILETLAVTLAIFGGNILWIWLGH